jgi:membrane-bound lytic murein transglycosylase F
MRRISFFSLLAFLMLFLSMTACDYIDSLNTKKQVKPKKNIAQEHLNNIKKRGKIIAATDYNDHEYFIYRDAPMGFQYDLLTQLSQHMGLQLEIVVLRNQPDALKSLNKFEYDILATDLAVTAEIKQKVLISDPIYQSKQVLVQRLPNNWRTLSKKEIEAKIIRDALDLQEKKVHIRKGSVSVNRLAQINEETGGDIIIIEDELSVEELVDMVAKGIINYTVCDSHVAAINKKYHNNIDIETHLGSYSQNLAWAFPKGSDSLQKEVNLWLAELKDGREFAQIYNKYFNSANLSEVSSVSHYSIPAGGISPFDESIKKYSKQIDWDWKLVTSLIYQESKFDPEVVSWNGAMGLMQMMPATANIYGISQKSSPEEQISAGVKYLKLLDAQLAPLVKDGAERRKFVLAAYNVGIAHVFDAQRLAKKYNKDPRKWDDHVDYYILNKSDPKYYQDPLCYYGYCRGSETYKFVNEIFDRYQTYQTLFK